MKTLIALCMGILFVALISACNEKVSNSKQDNTEVKKNVVPQNVKPKEVNVDKPAKEIKLSDSEVGEEKSDSDIAEEDNDSESVDKIDEESLDAFLVEQGDVVVKSIVIASLLEEKKPSDPGTSFVIGSSEKIFAYLDVKNETEEDAVLYVSWKRPGQDKEFGKTELSVRPSKSWHTWSFTRVAKWEGRWEAIVTNSESEVIARAPFMMTKAE